jgi:transcriptional regulator with XRE-family HTH domain
MPPQLLQKYERGAIRLSAGRLRGLAAALGVPMGFFCGQSEGPVVSFERVAVRELDDLVPFLSSEEGLELNRAFRRICDPKIRRRVAALIDAISRA